MTQIIRKFKINNYVEKFVFESSKLVEELINSNELLIINQPFIIQIKNCFKKTKNKKEIMTRAEKAKTKFIKQDSFDLEHVKVNSRCDDRSDRNDRDDRNEQNNKKIKKFFVVDIFVVDIFVVNIFVVNIAMIMKADI